MGLTTLGLCLLHATCYTLLMQILNKINERREKLKLTQQQLADAVNVSRQTIIAMEKGNYEPSLGLAMKLARCFKVSVEELFVLRQ